MATKTTAQKDDNGYPSWAGISCIDGITPIKITFDSVNGGMNIDTTTVISVVPANISENDGNGYPVVKGTSIVNNKIVLPWYVNPATGGVLMDIT